MKTRIWGTSGAGEGETPIEAFDAALLAAGIGNLNLVKVTSIVPPGAIVCEEPPRLEPGEIYYAAMATYRSRTMPLCASVGFAIPEDRSAGVIMEYSDTHADGQLATNIVSAALARSLKRRGYSPAGAEYDRQIFTSVVSRPFEFPYHAVVAAILLLP